MSRLWKNVILFLFAMVFLTACQTENSSLSENKVPPVQASDMSHMPENRGYGAQASISANTSKGKPQESGMADRLEVLEELRQFSDIIDIKDAGNNQLMVFADKIYLYDCMSARIVKQSEGNIPSGWFYAVLELYVLDNGYGIIGQNDKDEITCYLYDENLSLTREISILETLHIDPIFTSSAAVSTDGSILAVIDWPNAVYTYHMNTGETRKILDVTSPAAKTEGISGINRLGIAGNKIVFLYDSYPKDGQDTFISSAGCMNMDGSGLFTGSCEPLCKMKQNQYSRCVVLDEDMPDPPSGRAMLFYPENSEMKTIEFTRKAESGHVWISEKGNYIVTTERQDNKGWMLRIYEASNGQIRYEKWYNCPDTNAYREPYVYLKEDLGQIILYFRPLNENPYSMVDILKL